jgi:hypothetical protein
MDSQEQVETNNLKTKLKPMKKATVLFSLIFCFILTTNHVNAQATKSKFDLWPELKTFHGVMSGTFHPSEDGDLAPIKERSTEMVSKAMALSQSKIPADFNNKVVVEAVNKLVVDSKALDALIKSNADDGKIKQALSDLHDTFHLVVERCSKGGEPAEPHKEQKIEGRE